MYILICDDNRVYADGLREKIIEQCGVKGEQIRCIYEVESLLAAVQGNNGNRTAVVLDIEFGNDSKGIRAARELGEKYPWIPIIYLTAYPNFAREIGETDFISFLTKPVGVAPLKTALHKARRKIDREQIGFQANGKQVALQKACILYIERKVRISNIYVDPNFSKQPIPVVYPLDTLQEQLGKDYFARCHKSFLVNLSQIKELSKSGVRLKENTVVPVSRAFHPIIRNALLEFLKGGWI